jgi:Tfp pilus assembly protein PilX
MSFMRRTRAPRAIQRGSTMVVMMIVLVGLSAIAGLTVISVQGSAAATTVQRFDSIALYAAESGALAAMEWLEVNYDDAGGTKFSQYVEQDNVSPQMPAGIPGNNRQPGTFGNLLSTDQRAWYQVRILNNLGDSGLSVVGGEDHDGVVLIDVTGYGPNGAMKRLEWEVLRVPNAALSVAGQRPIVLIGWRELL